jgi:hypothetical protein
MSEYLSISPASVRAHLRRLRREAADMRWNGRDATDLDEQIDEAIWFLRKLSVAEIAIARAEVLGRYTG